MLDYSKRLTEVDEILHHLSEEDLKKIPDDVKQLIEENKDKEYTWNYNEEVPLKDQEISRDTIAILSYLNMEYLLNEEQKELMNVIHEMNEQEKRREEYFSGKKYNSDDLFKNNQHKENKEVKEKRIAMTEVKKDNFFRRIINKIKSLVKKK